MGFKWFVDGLVDGSIGFGGEESAGASFLRRDGRVWTTDKDGIIACLLAAELTARTLGRNPAEVYAEPDGAVRRARLPPDRRPGDARAEGAPGPADGRPTWPRRSWAATRSRRSSRRRRATARRSAGSRSTTANGWFAARPSGTENVTKLYAESFRGEEHLGRVLEEAAAIVAAAAS